MEKEAQSPPNPTQPELHIKAPQTLRAWARRNYISVSLRGGRVQHCSGALKADWRLLRADGAPADQEIYITVALLYSDTENKKGAGPPGKNGWAENVWPGVTA